METDGRVEKQSTVFPHLLAKRLGAFCTVPTGFTAVNPQTTKPDISLATKTGHFYLLPTEYWKFAEICIVGNFSISPSNAEISNDAVSNLFEFHSIDDVLKGAAVIVELVLRRNAHKVIDGAIGTDGRNDPVGLPPSRRRLIGCFRNQSRLAVDSRSLVASGNPHIGIRSLQVIQQLIGCFLQ